jgi:hypothetical protein
MADCQLIKDRLDSLIEERVSIAGELREPGLSPAARRALLTELRLINQTIATTRREYDRCINPPLPRPDLVAKTFEIRTNIAERKISVAGVIRNGGDGPATGPFEIVLGVSYVDAELQTISRVRSFLVPASITIEGFGTEYTTEAMENIPLLYRDENFNFVYTLDLLVDSEKQLAESSELNNSLTLRYWRVSPALAASPSREVELLTPSIPIPPPMR